MGGVLMGQADPICQLLNASLSIVERFEQGDPSRHGDHPQPLGGQLHDLR